MPVLARAPKRKRPAQDGGERAYAYAKACGIIGKSFVGKRIPQLARLNSLAELDRLVFSEVLRELPGRELLADLEKRILRRTVEHILAVVDSFSSPPDLLVLQLRSCEYADLKTCLYHISSGRQAPPLLSDIGRFRTVRFEAYPDPARMLAGTEFESILSKYYRSIKTPGFDLTPLEAELDLHYYTRLSGSLRRLSVSDRFYAQRILAEEISLRNCVWALRLRSYFRKKPEETAGYLMNLKIPARLYGTAPIPGGIRPRSSASQASSGREISLAAEALQSLQFPLDSRPAWKNWRWERFLNPQGADEMWAADPRHFQNAASRYIYSLSMRCFRQAPFSISSSYCYIKLKQFEEDLLTSVTEGLALQMTGKDVFDLTGAPL